MAITRCRSCACISGSRATSGVFRGTTAEASTRLFFHRRRRHERANDGCAGANSTWAHELVQSFLETGIRFADTFRVLNNCFAIGKESGHGKGHRDSMVAETGESRPAQRRRSMDFEAVIQLDYLNAHSPQIVRDRRDPITLLNAKLMGVANDGRAISQCT